MTHNNYRDIIYPTLDIRGDFLIRALILYFLSIKPTHGYEIQKYIQINQMNDWTKIQSGSIYYALSKLEKEGLIRIEREEHIGKKLRKVYAITNEGRLEFERVLSKELAKPICDVKSDKYVAYPFICTLSKERLINETKKHIDKLKKNKEEMVKWQKIKVKQQSLNIEKISFEMIISSYDYQIKWHEELINEIDKCIKISENVSEIIKKFDFTELDTLGLLQKYKELFEG